MPTLLEIKDALDEGLIGGALRKKLHLHEDIKGPLFPIRESAPPMMGMEPLLPSREPHPQSFRNSPEHTPEPDNVALEVPAETFIRYLDRHEKSEMEKIIKSHIESLTNFETWLAQEIKAGRVADREEYYENYHYGSPYEELDHELTNFDHRLTKMGLLDYRKQWETHNKLSPVPYVLNEWFEEIARQYHEDAYIGFGGYVEIPERAGDSEVPLVVDESTTISEQVHEDDQWEGEDEEAEGTALTPFTKKETVILNFLAKHFTLYDLNQISTNTDLYPYSGEINKRWKDAMKLFGHTLPEEWGEMEKKSEAAKYAKWAHDNWDEENRGEDGEMDYSKVPNPIKVLPKWYEVNYEETVSQVEFRSGTVDLIAFDEDDALNKGEREFFDWGGETEVDDYGDSERFDHETTSAEYVRLAEEIKNLIKKQPLTEQDRDKDSWTDEEAEGEERKPFTPKESKILDILKKTFTRDELQNLSTSTYPYGANQLGKRWKDLMKLFGHSSIGMEESVETSKYAKWAYDNWDFAEDLGAYSKIKAPFKSLPKWYEVDYDESASQMEYRRGSTEVVAFDEDDAYERGHEEFYDWEGEVEVYDYGDQDVHDSEITDVRYRGLAESTSSRRTHEEITQFLDDNYKDKFLKLYRLYNIGKEHGEKLVGGVGDSNIKQFLKEVQFILYSNRWIPQWTASPNVWDYTGEGYIPWDRSPFGRMSLHSSVIKWAQNILLVDILSKEEYIKNAYDWLDTQFPTVVPNEYYPFGEGQFNDAIRSIVHTAGLTWHEAQIVVDNFWREKRNAGKVTASGRAEREADEERRSKHDELDEDRKIALTKGLLEEEEQKRALREEKSEWEREIGGTKWPNELKRMYEPFKESLFKYWDNKGPHNDPHILKLLGLDTRKERGLYKIIDEWLVEWYGGRDEAVEVAKEKLKGIHQVIDGGYDFKYVVTSIDDEVIPWTKEQKARRKEGLSDHEVGVFVILDGSGIVNLALGGHDSYTVWDIFHDHHWWSDGDYEEECRTCGLRRSVRDDSEDDLTRANRVSDEPDEELKEEVQQEIDEVLHGSLTDLLNATGIGISYVTIKGTTSTYQFPPKEYIHEAADMFGQGLLEPIELQPYDTEEDWEEDVAKIEVPDDDEETDYDEEYEYDYEGPETDPEIGFVAPSRDVTENICKVRGFCKAQGPITFGQLKALVEAATSKRIASDMGRGIFKSLWRIIPFFLPQVLFAAVGITATRALNKIITPALKDTKGYKRWWGKVVLKAMDIAEGDYIPDVALGDDPLSKIFFVSDGLLEMIRDKYKLKFARYVADVAAAQPDDKPVPEWFVENLLRDYLNQKFLLDPPLGPKHGVDIKKTLREQTEQERSAVLLDGTSSAGKSYTLKYLKALPYWHPKADSNGWVVIASDDFSGMGEGEKRRLELDHPNIKDWAEGNEFGIASGLIRNDPRKENPPENPYEDEYIDGTDSRLWYMAQEFKTGRWKGVIFDDIGKDIIKYLPDVKFKHILLHTPIHFLLENVKERNDRAKEDDKRNPEEVLKQYLQKYEATRPAPNINVGDPTTEITKGWLEDIFKEYNISEKFTEFFIDELGIKDEGSYWVKVKNEYLTPDIQLVNVGSDREEYLKTDTIKDIKKTLREQREEEVSPVLKHGDIVRPIDIPERREQSSFGPPIPFGLYWVWHPTYGTPKSEGEYIVVPIEDVHELQMSGYLRGGDEDEGLPGHLHRHLRVLSRSRNHQWLKAELSDEKKAQYKQEALSRYKRDLIPEHTQEKLNPPLRVGDEILVLSKGDREDVGFGGGMLSMGVVKGEWTQPDLYVPYKVASVKQSNETQEIYYDLKTMEGEEEDIIVGGKMVDKTLNSNDRWMLRPEFRSEETLQEHKETQEINPHITTGDIIRVVDINRENHMRHSPQIPKLFEVYWVWKPNPYDDEGYYIFPVEWMEKGFKMHERAPYALSPLGGDKWVKVEKESLQEQEERDMSPPLEAGDMIKIIEKTDEDSYLNLWDEYVVLSPLWQDGSPEGWTVTGKWDDGWKNRKVYGYVVMREDLIRDFNNPNLHQDMVVNGHKWLKTGKYESSIAHLQEERQKNPSPDLQEGDEIIVLHVDGTHENEPETFVPYKVIKRVREPRTKGTLSYHIEPINGRFPYWDDEKERWEVEKWQEKGKRAGLWTRTTKIIYEVGDEWIFRPGFKREEEEISEDGELRQGKSLTGPQSQLIRGFDKWKNLKEHQEKVNPPIDVGDTITVVAYEDPDVEYMTDDELKRFMENQEVKDTLQGDWHNYEETADLMGFKWREGMGWYHEKELSDQNPDLFVPYRIVQKVEIGWKEGDVIRYLLLTLPELEEHNDEKREMWASGRVKGLDYRWLYPSEVRYIMSPTSKSLQEQDSKKVEVNPPLKPGDKIKVIDVDEDSDQRREFMNGMNIITSERFPKLYHTYTVIDNLEEMKWSIEGRGGGSPRYGWTRGYEGSGLDIDEGTQLLWLLMDKKDEDELLRYTEGRRVGYKVIAPYFDKWVKVEDAEVLQEQTEEKLNPQLRVGDEILVIHVEESGDKGEWRRERDRIWVKPELYEPYVVTAIKFRQPENWEGPEADLKYYEVEPIGLTDEDKRFGIAVNKWMGREKRLYPADRWMHNPDFQREELNEQTEDKLNPELRVGDEIIVIDKDRRGREEYGGVRTTIPKLYEPYLITAIKFRQPENLEGPDADLKFYELEPIDLIQKEKEEEGNVGYKYMGRRRLYPNDTWIYNPTFRREELNEHKESKLNPPLEIGDKIRVIDLYDGEGLAPKRFGLYQVKHKGYRQIRDSHKADYDKAWYQLVEIDEEGKPIKFPGEYAGTGDKRLYHNDTWIYADIPQTISEQDFPFNLDNKKQEPDHPKGEPPWSIRRGKQHYAMNVDPTPQEPVTALNNYLVKNSPFNFLGFDYYLSTVPGNMPGEARIDVYIPVLDDSATADGIWKDTLEYYSKKEDSDERREWDITGDPIGARRVDTSEYEGWDAEDPYYMEEIPMRDVGYHGKWPDFYGYDEFYDYHPEVVKQYERRESDYINPDGKVYETSWRERFNLVKDEMKGLAKLFGLENAVINRDPGHPWKRQQDSYGSQDIRPGTDIPYGWPRESEE